MVVLSRCLRKILSSNPRIICIPRTCSRIQDRFRHLSSSQRADVRGTIPFLGHGVAVGQYAEVSEHDADRRWTTENYVFLVGSAQRSIMLFNCKSQQKERHFNLEEIEEFGDLIGDKNILHSSGLQWNKILTELPHLEALEDSGLIRFDESQRNSGTMKPIVHGIFVSGLFSSIFGSLSPGCVYMNQTLNFSNPVHAEEIVLARIEIEKIRRWRRGGVVLQCSTTVSVGRDATTGAFKNMAVTGTANVWLPSGYQKN